MGNSVVAVKAIYDMAILINGWNLTSITVMDFERLAADFKAA